MIKHHIVNGKKVEVVFRRDGFKHSPAKSKLEIEKLKEKPSTFKPYKSKRTFATSEVKRPSFYRENIKGRHRINRDRIDPNVTKVELTEKTLNKLLKIKIPDPKDIEWLAEKKRLIAKYISEGRTKEEAEELVKIVKPLGRDQRTIDKLTNLAQLNLDVNSKLKELKQEIIENRANTPAQVGAIAGNLINILQDPNAVRDIEKQPDDVFALLNSLTLPLDYQAYGLTSRFIDNDLYTNNRGKIHFFLLLRSVNDPNPAISIEQPLYGVNNRTVRLSSLRASLSSRDTILDLETRQIITKEEADKILAEEGGLKQKEVDSDDDI